MTWLASDFSAISYNHIMIGNFLNAVIAFLLVAAAVYFFIVLPANALMARFHKPVPDTSPATKVCPECWSDILAAAKRCSHCTIAIASDIAPHGQPVRRKLIVPLWPADLDFLQNTYRFANAATR